MDEEMKLSLLMRGLSEPTMKKMIHEVNYPKMSLYHHRYADYLNAPVKVVLDTYLARGYVLKGEPVQEGDVVIDEIYIPAIPSNGYQQDYIIERIFTPFTDQTIIFNDAYNTGSDILGDHYLQYKTSTLEACEQLPNGKYYIKETDVRKDGSVHTGRFRIYPHPGHRCIADLLKWGHCYHFDESTNSWVYDENKQNHVTKFMKGSMKLKIQDEVGDNQERIADYAKLIYWLMWRNKDGLDKEQQVLLKELVPNNEQITKILKRDLLIHQLIKRILDEDVPDHYQFEL